MTDQEGRAPKMGDTMLGEGGRGSMAADMFFRGLRMWLDEGLECRFGIIALFTHSFWHPHTFLGLDEVP